MAHTFDSALADDLVEVVSRDDSMGIFEIQIGTLKTIITIDLGRFMDSEWTKFRISHAIKTPVQIGPYRTSRPFSDYPAYALQQAISGLAGAYREAVNAGYTPKENWLVEY